MRWHWPWNSPNALGAFLVVILPWVWCATEAVRIRLLRFALAALELALLYAFCKTYSRGALLALLAGGSAYIVYWVRARGRLSAAATGAIVARCLTLAGMLVLTGFFERLAHPSISDSLSAEHRIPVWEGGLRMIASAPFSGWGFGDAGFHYIHWFQRLDITIPNGNLVSGVLQAMVDWGLPMFSALMFPIFFCVLAPLVTQTRNGGAESNAGCVNDVPARAAGAGVVAFVVANLFSTLGGFWSLDVVPVLCVLFCLERSFKASRVFLRRLALAAFSFAFLLSGSAWLAGSLLARGDAIRVARLSDGAILLCRSNAAPDSKTVEVIPDKKVLGEVYGRAIRRLVLAAEPKWRFIVHSVPFGSHVEGSAVVLWFGDTAALCPSGVVSKSVFVHPILSACDPIAALAPVLILPQVDQLGQNGYWTRRARDKKIPVIFSPGVGIDIRPTWPDVVMPVLGRHD